MSRHASFSTPKNLEPYIAKLAEKLEDDPDPWFANPQGYLKKPPYGRAAQETINIIKKTAFSTILTKGYRYRWFVLDVPNLKLSYYLNSDDDAKEKGFVDMSQIIDIQYSQVFDAPEFSIDLISKDRHYTVVMENHTDMIKWAFAFSLCHSKWISINHPRWILLKNKVPLDIKYDRISPEYYYDREHTNNPSNTDITKMSARDQFTTATANNANAANNNAVNSRWYEYEVTYTDANVPLMLNTVAIINRDRDGKLVNHLLAVTSFDFNIEDGTPGVSESSGMISIKDYIISVNSVDLTKLDGTIALLTIQNASFPKTLHFIRDELGMKEGPKIEGWSFVKYPGMVSGTQNRKLRYVEFTYDTLNFFKVEAGGSVSAIKDTFFKFTQVEKIECIIDELHISSTATSASGKGNNNNNNSTTNSNNSNSYSGQEYIILLKCKPKSIIKHIGYEKGSPQQPTNNNNDDCNNVIFDNSVCIGATYVDTLELTFPTLKHLNRWRSAFSSPINILPTTATTNTTSTITSQSSSSGESNMNNGKFHVLASSLQVISNK